MSSLGNEFNDTTTPVELGLSGLGAAPEQPKKKGRPQGSQSKTRKTAMCVKIDEQLLSVLKEIASRSGVSLGRVVEDAAKYLVANSDYNRLLEVGVNVRAIEHRYQDPEIH